MEPVRALCGFYSFVRFDVVPLDYGYVQARHGDEEQRVMVGGGSSARLEDLTPGARVRGVVGTGEVTVVSVTWHGSNALTLAFRDDNGALDDCILYRDHEAKLRVTAAGPSQSFDADPDEFKLAAEALRIRMAARFDPMLAVSTSAVEPLPHQLRAVYGELLPRTPLRFLLADDPGAGKTIMAGLYIKELFLRGDLARCLIVAPGSLVEQWQDELLEKFGMRFTILERSMIDAEPDTSPFDRHPLMIARMDQLSRSEELRPGLERSDWDLIVVDEAHRMSAHYFGQELKTTRRYQLGLLLGRIARHLLLMTATPHAGKEEDFQLFMALLDGDRFEGRFRDGVHAVDVDGLMRRMVKEELLTFEGKPLFPERRAYHVPYQLSAGEKDLYEAVTQYVRDEMNRADRLKAEGQGRRSNTVGFALTVLQRRLASSPEAIWRSLERRRRRLEKRRQEMLAGPTDASPLEDRLAGLLGRTDAQVEAAIDDDLDELDGAEVEDLEEEVADAATAARTIAELEVEIGILADLETLARRVRFSGTDRKWSELRELLLDHKAVRDPAGHPRKIIVFTEHRDTLTYLVNQITTLLGRPESVVAIHGGIRREERRRVQELFTGDPDVHVLVATDAAGEGLNLQRAHLMVNYDLPWNPNRLEQRFGRIHRIGQTEVCHLWNLIAADTREGAVYLRLLEKVDQQRRAYGSGKVFDVLGEAFEGTPLRLLLMEAIRYGDDPQVRDKVNQVIDASVGEGIDALMAERALAQDTMSPSDVTEIRLRMEQARARRLQPHYIKAFFTEAFTRLGGRMVSREADRYEITHVPGIVRDRDRIMGVGAPVLTKYERITFLPDRINVPGLPKAQLLAPGHPLLDAVVDLTIEAHSTALKHGTVLVDPTDLGEQPRLLVALEQQITDAHQPPRTVSKQFAFVEIAPDGAATSVGPAPYLDYDRPEPGHQQALDEASNAGWLAAGPEAIALDWAIEHGSREHLQDVTDRISSQVNKTRLQVRERLIAEINYQDARYLDLVDQQSMGKELKVSPDTAYRRARDLERRLESRLAQLTVDERLNARPPRVVGAALVIPKGYLDRAAGLRAQPIATFARETAEVERRAVDAVLAAERALGRTPHEMAHNNPGFDIMSETSYGQVITIEVKGRIAGADDVIITKNEVLIGKNKGHQHRLALVEVSPTSPADDRLVYLVDPFADTPDPGFNVTKLIFNWDRLWKSGGSAQ